MEKYEYYITRCDNFNNVEMTKILDNLSADGWELIAVTPINSNGNTVWINYTMRRLRE